METEYKCSPGNDRYCVNCFKRGEPFCYVKVLANPPSRMSHHYEDVSHHGSAVYMCQFCNLGKDVEDLDCLAGVAWIIKCSKDRERDDLFDYNHIVSEQRRFEFLKSRFGG